MPPKTLSACRFSVCRAAAGQQQERCGQAGHCMAAHRAAAERRSASLGQLDLDETATNCNLHQLGVPLFASIADGCRLPWPVMSSAPSQQQRILPRWTTAHGDDTAMYERLLWLRWIHVEIVEKDVFGKDRPGTYHFAVYKNNAHMNVCNKDMSLPACRRNVWGRHMAEKQKSAEAGAPYA